MPRSLAEYLQHILDEIEYLSKTTRNTDKDRFLNDETLRRSFVRSIEIIGEAVKQIPESTRKQYPQIEGRSIARHEGSIDSQLLWSRLRDCLGRSR